MNDNDIKSGISYNITDTEAIKHLTERVIRIRDAYHINCNDICYKEIRNIIKLQLTIGYKEGFTINQVAELIKKELAGFVNISMDQALAIATTEILGAASYSRYLSIKNSRYRKKKWFTANDEKVRPLHREMHGKKVNVSDPWIFSDGNTLRYPGDHDGPDHLVVNCRCIEVVVFESHEFFINGDNAG